MQAAVCTGAEVLEIAEKNIPSITDEDALVRVSHCGISKWDVESYLGENPQLQLPRILGHEICGTVKQLTPSQDNGISLGTKVLVNPILSCGRCIQCQAGRSNHCEDLKFIGLDLDGGFAEFVKAPIKNLQPLQNEANPEKYILAFPLSAAHHLVSRIDFRDVDHIVINGSGPVGVLAGLILKEKKNIRLDMIDTNSFRLNIARNLGLFCIDGRQSRLHEIIKERCFPGKDGPDVVIETSGNPAGLDWAIRWVRVQGQMIVGGRIPGKGSFDFTNLLEKEISLTGTLAYTQEDLDKSLSDISNLRIDYQTLITHRLPLAGVREGLRILRSVEETMKIVICMDPFK